MNYTECSICLDKIVDNIFKCSNCSNIFHINCINKIHKKNCPLCRHILQESFNSYIFNNHDDSGKIYDINKYISKWGKHKCLKNKHKFLLETLGDWKNNNQTLVFDYKCMHIECLDCNIKSIIK